MPEISFPTDYNGCRLLHAGPTTGKTTLLGAMFNMGVFIFDTDDLLEHPRFFKLYLDSSLWKQLGPKTPEREAVSRFKDSGTIAFLIGSKLNFAITNLWGLPIQQYARDFVSIQPSPEVVAERLCKRGQFKSVADALPLAKKWTSTWVKYRDVAFDYHIEASRDSYLSDYLGLDESCFKDLKAVEKAAKERSRMAQSFIDSYLSDKMISASVPTMVVDSFYKSLSLEISGTPRPLKGTGHPPKLTIKQQVPEYFRKRV